MVSSVRCPDIKCTGLTQQLWPHNCPSDGSTHTCAVQQGHRSSARLQSPQNVIPRSRGLFDETESHVTQAGLQLAM